MREARWLHSRERRLVGDGIRRVLETEAILDARSGLDASTDLHRWIGWLVEEGLPVEEAAAIVPEIAWRARPSADAVVDGLDPVAIFSKIGSFDLGFSGIAVASLGEEAGAFVRACRERAAVDLRVQRVDRDRARASLLRDGVASEPVDGVPGALRVQGRANLQATDAWRRGWIEVQDAGSQLVSALVDADDGPIVDLCAGAGGKTLAIAAAAPKARIIAADVRGRALDECRRRARKAGVAKLRIVKLNPDGSLPDGLVSMQASRVLVDAPCSGSGTLRRHPELRLRLTPEVVEENQRLQKQILGRAAGMVRPGGRLIYATCSVLQEENRRAVDAFLAEHPSFSRRDASAWIPASFCVDGDLQVSPHRHRLDGFYGSVLVREAP